MTRTRIPSIFLLCLSFAALPLHAEDGKNLITNGNFEIADADGRPADWKISHPEHLKKCETTVEMLTEGDKTFYRVTKNAGSGPGIGWQKIQLSPNTQSLRVTAKIRGQSIVRGGEGWQMPGIGITYFFDDLDENAKPGDVSKWILAPAGDSDWQEYETIIPVRDNAPIANIAMIGEGWTGTADFADIVVEAIE